MSAGYPTQKLSWVLAAGIVVVPVVVYVRAATPRSCSRSIDRDIAQLHALKASLERCEGDRESAVEALRDFVRGSERREVLEGLVTSPDGDRRCLGRFALAADERLAREVYWGLRASDESGVRLQAQLMTCGLPAVETARLGRLETESYVARAKEVAGREFMEGDRFVARDIRTSVEERVVVLSHYFHGAYGQHETIFVFGKRRRLPLDALTISDGSSRWIEFGGRTSLLASDIYCEGAGSRAEAWVGVVAVRHRVFDLSEGRFVERDCFFTPFRGQYP